MAHHTQKQVKKDTGVGYKFNLDSISLACLNACQQHHKNHGNEFSNSVIVRRAVRRYLKHLEATRHDYRSEEVETKRALKGVQ
ncbi:hypothetical protein KP005_11980 [Geomonas nitrogeniifigens]|uniref:Uncharacterized protein n=1 Tax=Geomonas diazotrophica TaxID=2843197 RepID=A0ABX8JHG7_9BACT|nr:hypothetical protein [Geomonas nitrogeniifigens]QWV96099.1 hypothetical protein KP005_11980 [Geomonas nitrogeniifigens]